MANKFSEDIEREVKKLLLKGYSFRKIQRVIKEKYGESIALGTIHNWAVKFREDMFAVFELARIVLERIGKRQWLEREAEMVYRDAKADFGATASERIAALRLLKDVIKDNDDFYARFGLLPAEKLEIKEAEEVDILAMVEVLKRGDKIKKKLDMVGKKRD